MSTICCGREWPKSGSKVELADDQPANSPVEPPNGRYNAKLDDKGRLKLPVPFQTFLASISNKGLFVTSIDRTTAQIYPIANWRANLKLFSEQRENKKFAQVLLFNAQDLGADAEMDNQGRITVNTELRKGLDMDGQGLHVYWKGDHITLFTDAHYQKLRADAITNSATALEKMEEAGLQ
jgi:MraZ protein